MSKNKINNITFEYNSHNNILTKISYTDEVGNSNIVTSNVLMKIEEEKDNKYFSNEKIYENNSFLNNFKSVYYYDRITATLETDPIRKAKLNEAFNKSEEIKNVLFVSSNEDKDLIVFENIDTKDIKFQISNKSLAKKNNFDNFNEIFYSSNIKNEELDLINSIRFANVSYSLSKEIVDKVSKTISIALIKNHQDFFENKVTIENVPEVSKSLNAYLLEKYFNIQNPKLEEELCDFDEVFESDKKYDNEFENHHSFLSALSDVRNLRNYQNFISVLDSEEAKDVARTYIPLQNDINRIKKIRFDALLLNQEENYNPESLSKFYKENKYGFACIQDSKNELYSKNLYALEVDKNFLQLNLSASFSRECDSLNKILDMRKITDIEQRKKIFTAMYSDTNKNITVITKNINDISFMVSKTKNGNFYKIDERYLKEASEDSIYIADIMEIAYSYELDFSPLETPNTYIVSKRLIEFPKYDESVSYIKNISNAKNALIEKVISQKESINNETTIKGKIDSLYKYEKLYSEIKEFDIAPINKQYQNIKKTDEFYSFAKSNIGGFFKGNLELIFSSFNVAKEKKAFNNDFYYNISSSVSIDDLESSIALSSHISRMPTGEIVSKIAKKFNINITADKPFSLSDIEQNKLNVGKKDFVTSTKLGAMKFGYLPKTFELKDSDKEVLIKIVSDILKTNPKMSEEKLPQEIENLSKALKEASYLVMKNEQTVIDGNKFAPKEILVLIDENLKDISKLNLSISDFYQKLEDEKIFDIKDYVEVAKANSIYLEKITAGLSNMISEFKKEQLKYSGIDIETFKEEVEKSTIETADGKTITYFDLLMSDANKVSKDNRFEALGNKLKVINYYEQFLNFESTEDLIKWFQSQKVDKKKSETIINILETQFSGNEIKIVEQNSVGLFTFLQNELGEENKSLYEKLEEKIYKLYHNKKTAKKIVVKTAKLYAIESFMENSLDKLQKIDKTLSKQQILQEKTKIYTSMRNALESISKDIMGLTHAQYEEALNFSILKSNNMKDTQMLFWEMRQGKTRASIAAKLFTSFIGNTKNLQRNIMFVQNKNLDDIAEQVVDFLPVLAKDIMFNSSNEVYIFNKKKSLELPVNISKQINPQIIQMLKDSIKYQGQKDSLKSDTVILSATYTKDMNQIHKQVKTKTLDELLKLYENSPFIEVLKLGNKKKVDKEIEKSIMQSFVYIQMLFEKKFLLAEDKDFILEKMEAFVEKYISAKETLKNNNLSKLGIDLIPKNVMYSINVDSPITDVTLDKKNEKKKIGKAHLSTPYQIENDEVKEIQMVNFDSEQQKKNYYELLTTYLEMPSKLSDLTEENKIYKVATSFSDIEAINSKEKIATLFIEQNIPELNDEVLDIVNEYIKKQNINSSMVSSPIYKIEGLDEQIKDTLEVNIGEIFRIEKFEDFIKDYNISNETKKELIDLISDSKKMVNFSKKLNSDYFNDIVYKLYDTTLAGTVAKRIELISPILSKKHKELSYAFKMDLKISESQLVYPIRKNMIENKTQYFYDTVSLSSTGIDLNNLSQPTKKDVSGLEIEFGYSNGLPIFTVKREQKEELLLDLIVKKNENLNNSYTIDLKPDLTNITIDESHKGLKKNSSSLNIHDVTSYMHKLAISNNGTFGGMTGTPFSGMARDIGKIMTTGVNTALSSSISRNIDAYCTTYEFKDNLDAILFSALEAFPKGHIFKAFEKIIVIPENGTFNTDEKLSLTEEEIKGIGEEIKEIINAMPTLDYLEKQELSRSKNNTKTIASKFDYYKQIFKMEENLKKIEDSKVVKRKVNDVKSLLLGKIDKLTKKVPGVNNFATLADIIKKIGTTNSINISRVNENTKYNILDKELLKKLSDGKDIKTPISFDVNNYKDKTLGFSAFLDSYKSKLKLGEIKEKLNNIFEAWVVDMFSEQNQNKTIRYLGLDAKMGIKDTKISENEITKINSLMSRSGKTVNDSATDIFNTLYFGSEKEKYELSVDRDKKEKVEFVINILDKFMDFTDKYNEFQNSARISYENEKIKAKDENREPNKIFINQDGFLFDASKFEELSPDLENIRLFNKIPSQTPLHIVTLTNDGGVLLDNMPLTFKAELNVNKWEHIYNGTLDLNYSLTNIQESEILEYLASDSKNLYLSHINKQENIRLMSSRNATLAISFLDSIDSLIQREDKSKKAVVILNKTSSKNYNFTKIINNIKPNILKEANIDIKLSQSTTFAETLYEVQKNKNNQIVVVGNVAALAEGIDMSCIDTGFYLGSLKDSAVSLQSFARQNNAQKSISNIYLGNNGAFSRYRFNESVKAENFIDASSSLKFISKALFKGSVDLTSSNLQEELSSLQHMKYCSTVSSIVLSTNTTFARLEAYEAIMSGKYPKQEIDYNKTSLLSFSDYYNNKDKVNAQNKSVSKEAVTIDAEAIEVEKNEDLSI